jgi:hypothetical protein
MLQIHNGKCKVTLHTITQVLWMQYATRNSNLQGRLQVDEVKLPLMCKLKRNSSDNFIIQHIIDGLLTELVYVVGTSDRCRDYTNCRNINSYRLVNVPKHDNATTFYKLARREDSVWVESLLEILSSNSKEKKDTAKWLAM